MEDEFFYKYEQIIFYQSQFVIEYWMWFRMDNSIPYIFCYDHRVVYFHIKTKTENASALKHEELNRKQATRKFLNCI